MAAPAAVLAAKAVLAAGTTKRGRTVIASVIAAVLTPFILIVLVVMSALAGTASHNNAAVDLVFHGGYLSSSLPADYRMYIEKMRESFSELEDVLSGINEIAEDGEVDVYRVKSVFYSLFFGADQPRMDGGDYQRFADCFVTYEEREDEDGETYMVAVPISDLETVYRNLTSEFGGAVTVEDRTNAGRIYMLAKYGNVSAGSGLPPGAAMGDGSFSGLYAGAEAPRPPALTAPVMCAGSIPSPVSITCRAPPLRESSTSARWCQGTKQSRGIWCFLLGHMLPPRQ